MTSPALPAVHRLPYAVSRLVLALAELQRQGFDAATYELLERELATARPTLKKLVARAKAAGLVAMDRERLGRGALGYLRLTQEGRDAAGLSTRLPPHGTRP